VPRGHVAHGQSEREAGNVPRFPLR
jgi:hypothetical protein